MTELKELKLRLLDAGFVLTDFDGREIGLSNSKDALLEIGTLIGHTDGNVLEEIKTKKYIRSKGDNPATRAIILGVVKENINISGKCGTTGAIVKQINDKELYVGSDGQPKKISESTVSSYLSMYRLKINEWEAKWKSKIKPKADKTKSDGNGNEENDPDRIYKPFGLNKNTHVDKADYTKIEGNLEV